VDDAGPEGVQATGGSWHEAKQTAASGQFAHQQAFDAAAWQKRLAVAKYLCH